MSSPACNAESAKRVDDLLALARLSTEPESPDTILDWLANRVAGTVALLDHDGRTLTTSGRGPRSARASLAPAARVVPGMHRQGTPTAVVAGDAAWMIHIIRLDGVAANAGSRVADAPLPYLVVIDPAERQCGDLLGDAARILSLCWQLSEATRVRRQVETAEARTREAVLHLLMNGSVPAARRIAATLRPKLTDLINVYVIESSAPERAELTAQLNDLSTPAWVVPCPVRSNHLIALVPADAPAHGRSPRVTGPAPSPDRLAEDLAGRVPRCKIGVSDEMPLRQTATAYEQAFHALAVARGTPDGFARSGARTDLAPSLGTAGQNWARALLRPCLSYVPGRRADPTGGELLDTLNSWLTFDSGTSRHLKIHRNTLAARLRLLGDLLSLDLGIMRGQAAAWLALRLHWAQSDAGVLSGPYSAAALGAEGSNPSRLGDLDELLAAPGAQAWARLQLHPLEQGGLPHGAGTVHAWLRADTRLPATAAALGLSLPGTRKRLVRAEETLGRSLLRAPSAKYELWLAMRALDRL